MKIFHIRDFVEYQAFLLKTDQEYKDHLDLLVKLIALEDKDFYTQGYSYTGRKSVRFISDFKYGPGFPHVNWRERVICPITGLNNRMRAAIHYFDLMSNTFSSSNVYRTCAPVLQP